MVPFYLSYKVLVIRAYCFFYSYNPSPLLHSMVYVSEALSSLWYSFLCCQRSATSSKLHRLPLSSPSRAVNSRCRRAKREQDESPCGDLASETATRWRPRSEAPLWVSSGFLNVSVDVQWCEPVRLMYEQLSSVWLLGDRGGDTFHDSGPKVNGL